MSNRVEKIRSLLEAGLKPTHLEIYDDSQSHAGHGGAASGGGHFYATVVSAEFEGKNLVQRHRLVYQTLGDLMQTEIHAFSIKAFTTDEFSQQSE